jgi:HlyD family secretion protein
MMPKGLFVDLVLVTFVAFAASRLGLCAEEALHPAGAIPAKAWRAVAPGRVEPISGEIRIGTPVLGRIDEVLVKSNDKVFAGEPLIRLDDDEARARLSTAEAQVGFRKRLRNDQPPSKGAAERRKAEDAIAEEEKVAMEAQATVDRAAIARRKGTGSDADLEKAQAALAGAQNRLIQRRRELRSTEPELPLPTQMEGQLAVARAELTVAKIAIDKMTVRAPIAGTVLQVNAKPGELASPAASQALVVMGDLSAMRVRTEVDERDIAEITINQGVAVRATAFGEREFAGKVLSITPLVETSNSSARGPRKLADVNVIEVVVDLVEPGPLIVGMQVDVFFRTANP